MIREKGQSRQLARLNVDQRMVESGRQFAKEHAETIALLINRAREIYSQSLDQEIQPVSLAEVHREIDRLFADRFIGLNLAALIELANSLESEEDYETFIVDEILGQAIAETIATGVPHQNFARSTFHLIDGLFKKDLHAAVPLNALAQDDVLAGLAAGLEAILPGWEWMKRI